MSSKSITATRTTTTVTRRQRFNETAATPAALRGVVVVRVVLLLRLLQFDYIIDRLARCERRLTAACGESRVKVACSVGCSNGPSQRARAAGNSFIDHRFPCGQSTA